MIKEWKYGERKMTIKITPDKTGIFYCQLTMWMGQVAYFRFLIWVFRFSFLLRAGVLHESGYLPILATKKQGTF